MEFSMLKDKVTKESLIQALNDVIWYNGLGDYVRQMIDLEPNKNRYILCPYYELIMDDQCLETIWMICVLLFGDYGTSPRSGWIEDVDGYRAFLKTILPEEPLF